MAIVIYLVALMLIGVFSSVLILYPNYKYYKKIYNNLDNMDLEVFDDVVWTKNNSRFVWFMDSGGFKIAPGYYLHNSIVTYFDPYSLYWLIKYRRYFKKRFITV